MSGIEETMVRQVANYSTKSKERFLKKLSFKSQFHKLYQLRYQVITERIIKTIKLTSEYNGIPIVKKVCKIPRQGPCILLGTIIKPMKYKPNVLEQYSTNMVIDGSKLDRKKEGEKLIDESDKLLLEDISHDRIELKVSGNTNFKHEYVNGIVVGVLGFAAEKFFDVTKGRIIPPGTSNQYKIKNFGGTGGKVNKFVAFISGLGVNLDRSKWLHVQLSLDYLSGNIGSRNEVGNVTSKVVRLIMVGNGIHPRVVRKEEMFAVKGSLHSVRKGSSVEDIKYLDEMYSHIGQTLPLDVMPGPGDPTNTSLPQQPLHRCFFPKSTKYRQTIGFVTNPHEFSIDGVKFMGTSGQNIDDIRRFSSWEKGMDIMQKTLEWNHLAPTCPDTLDCYPFTEKDELIISQSPNVYFAGNQEEFEWKIQNGSNGQKMLILCIPKFCKRPCIVLVNIVDLSVKIVDIKLPEM